jgi:hypothetical protein
MITPGPSPSPSQAQCGSCLQAFGGVSVFDRHRRNGVCLLPSDLGMYRDARGVWRMEAPAVRPTHWATGGFSGTSEGGGKGGA